MQYLLTIFGPVPPTDREKIHVLSQSVTCKGTKVLQEGGTQAIYTADWYILLGTAAAIHAAGLEEN